MTNDEYHDFKDRIREAAGTPRVVELFREVEGVLAEDPTDPNVQYLIGFARGYASEVDQSLR